jgi:hypothetical protein
MANQQKPTKRTRLMDIKHFFLQDWVAELVLIIPLESIDIFDNYADVMTKATGHISFDQHINYILCKIIPRYCHKKLL